MAKPSKARKLWNKIDARIQFWKPNDLRGFFSAAAKFLIKSRHWDDSHPKTAFDHDPIIQMYHEGFEQFSKKEMLGGKEVKDSEEELIELLKKASGWDGKDLKSRAAKKKLTKLRQRMKKRLIHLIKTKARPLRGLHLYESAIRNKYLTKKKEKARSHKMGAS